MNPRVSRSSALASKATGFPIAKIAAKLAVGYTLDELYNDITRTTPASFEPTIDYVVMKIPRFTFEKFPGTPALLTTSMKSVGEAMAIGRSFAEALQKGLRSMETGFSGLDAVEPPGDGGAGCFPRRAVRPAPRSAADGGSGFARRAVGRGHPRRFANSIPGSCANSPASSRPSTRSKPSACRPMRPPCAG